MLSRKNFFRRRRNSGRESANCPAGQREFEASVVFWPILFQSLETVKKNLLKMGFHYQTTTISGGLVACTGNTGCQWASTNTKGQAVLLARFRNVNPARASLSFLAVILSRSSRRCSPSDQRVLNAIGPNNLKCLYPMAAGDNCL